MSAVSQYNIARPFDLDCTLRDYPNPPLECPQQYRLNQVRGCHWRIVDLNLGEGPLFTGYDVYFSRNGQNLIGKGEAVIPEPGILSYNTAFTGVK